MLLPLAAAPAFAMFNLSIQPTRAEPGPQKCGSYQIDGGIAFGVAAVAVTSDDAALVGHQVFAVFTDSAGGQLGEPVLLVTDALGAASMPAPPTATGVEFIAEAPATDCSGEPDTLSVTRVIPELAGQFAPAADFGAAGEVDIAVAELGVVPPEAPATGNPGAASSPDAPLPHTGRGLEVAAAVALICLVVGWWLGDWSRSGVAGQA